jgi:hypothetical protein
MSLFQAKQQWSRMSCNYPPSCQEVRSLNPYVDGRLPARVFVQCSDQIACVHMSGLLLRSHMNAGQDGFRDASSKHGGDFRCQWIQRSILRLGSIDHTICSLPCKFWHRLSTVAGELLPVSG